jgi:chromosome segregation ATPase
MKIALFLLTTLFVAPVAANDASPIAKVLQMISDLKSKIIVEGEASQKAYSEFAEWCEDRSKELTFEIKTGKAEVAELKATIDQETSTSSSLSVEIEKLAGEISVDEADLKAATEIREKESADFAANEKELVDIIDTLKRAVGILEREMAKSGASMMQLQNANGVAQALAVMVQASMLSTADAGKLTALVQSDDSDAGAPAAANYEGHSGGIVDTLTDLLEKAEAQLDEARSKETKDLHAFEMLKQSLTDEIKFGNKEMSEAKASLAASGEKKAAAEGDLGITSKDLSGDITALGDLHHDCMTKAEDFEAETKSRGEEIAALTKASEVITEATGGAEAQSYSLLQVNSGLSSRTSLAQFEAMRFVRDLARKTHSKELAMLATRMSSVAHAGSASQEDIFGKVKGLVRDMIEKLEAEAEADATEKGFCDKELAETNAKKDEKTTKIEKLSTKIDQMSARSAQLKEEVAALEKALSSLASTQAEMDKMRSEENAAYKTNRAEMEKGLDGVKLALKVLNEYYAKEDKAHSSADGAGSGIIGLLEVCESDFSKGLAEIISTEETAVSAYETETKENEIEKSTKEQDVKYKSKESTDLDKAVAETSNDKSSVQAELDAVMKYLKGIEDRCIAKAETHEERAARFKAEIEGLKQALQILNEEAAFIQKKSRTLRGVRLHVQ